MVTDFQYVPIDSRKFPHAKYFWAVEGTASKEQPYVHGIVPKGVCELLFIYKGSFVEPVSREVFKQGDFIIGAQKNTLGRYVLEEDFGVFGTCLQPYAIPILLSISGISLMNQDLVWSSRSKLANLQEQLDEARSNTERMSVMYSALFEIGKAVEGYDAGICNLVNQMADTPAKDLSSIATDANLSLRQFQRKFKNLTGYTPSHFLRIARLQPILEATNAANLTELAYQFGYYDQSHFINDFKKLTGGLTPGEYFAGLPELSWRSAGKNVTFFQS